MAITVLILKQTCQGAEIFMGEIFNFEVPPTMVGRKRKFIYLDPLKRPVSHFYYVIFRIKKR